jgi:serine/threonine-protein kinase
MVPDVTGLDPDSARAELESSGFKVQVEETEVSDPNQDNTVVSQTPPAGTEAKTGSKVKIVVGRFSGGTTTTEGESP